MVDLCFGRFGISRIRVPKRRVWIGRRVDERSPILQTKVQGEIGVGAITSGAALHLFRVQASYRIYMIYQVDM